MTDAPLPAEARGEKPAEDPADAFDLRAETPAIDTYLALRPACGMSGMSREAAERGLPNTLYGVVLYHRGEPVGMGRLVGDDGCFFVVTDICVLPRHQGLGLGKRIMEALSDEIDRRAPDAAYVSLIADGDAKYLYEKYGFTETAPASVGMARYPLRKPWTDPAAPEPAPIH